MTSKIRTHSIAVCLIVAFSTVASAELWAQSNSGANTITVMGQAIERVAPDQAMVRFSVVSKSLDPESARAENAENSKLSVEAIKNLGVPDKQIRLENLTLNPIRRWNNQTREYEELGFEVSRNIVVTLYKLNTVPSVVASVVQSGANRLGGVNYGLKSDFEARTSALVTAVRRANERARRMAEAAGATIGSVLSIHEQGVQPPTPVVARATVQFEKADAGEPQAFPAGDLEISATVVVSFSLNTKM